MKFSVVFIFCVSFVKERNCSLRLIPKREQDRSERNAKSWLYALAGGGAPSNAVTRTISWREIAVEQPEAREAGG
jgi:hypothetical protein